MLDTHLAFLVEISSPSPTYHPPFSLPLSIHLSLLQIRQTHPTHQLTKTNPILTTNNDHASPNAHQYPSTPSPPHPHPALPNPPPLPPQRTPSSLLASNLHPALGSCRAITTYSSSSSSSRRRRCQEYEETTARAW